MHTIQIGHLFGRQKMDRRLGKEILAMVEKTTKDQQKLRWNEVKRIREKHNNKKQNTHLMRISKEGEKKRKN